MLINPKNVQIANKVRIFFRRYATNRHKATIATPGEMKNTKCLCFGQVYVVIKYLKSNLNFLYSRFLTLCKFLGWMDGWMDLSVEPVGIVRILRSFNTFQHTTPTLTATRTIAMTTDHFCTRICPTNSNALRNWCEC